MPELRPAGELQVPAAQRVPKSAGEHRRQSRLRDRVRPLGVQHARGMRPSGRVTVALLIRFSGTVLSPFFTTPVSTFPVPTIPCR